MIRFILYYTCAFLLLISLGCVPHENHHLKPEGLPVTTPLRKDTSSVRSYVCQIHSSNHIEIRALERGYLEKVYVDEGKFIQKGSPMFQVMPQLYKAEYDKAKAEADFATIEYANTKNLADSNVVSPNELALAKARLDKAHAELKLAETHLSFTQIRAPFSGIMDRLHVRSGSLVEEDEVLTKLSDNSTMWVYFNVPEAEYLDLAASMNKTDTIPVELELANGKLFNEAGFIETIEADFNNETGNIAFRASFPNPTGLLRHGETGNILIRNPLREALIIPQKATFEVLDKVYVYVLDSDNKLHAKEIKIASELPHLFVVSEGLNETDTFLLEGLRLVQENQVVIPQYTEPGFTLSNLSLHAE